jgi:hypothetical protein
MSDATEIGLTPVGEGDVLMRRSYAARPHRHLPAAGGHPQLRRYGLHQDIADRYAPRTVDLLVVELTTHADLLRRATALSTKEVR